MDLRETYNLIAEDWHKDHTADSWWIAPTDFFLSMLKPGARILDAGCASGMKSRYMIQRGMRVVGIDFSERLIDIAKRELPQGEFVVGDMRDVGALEGTFDAVFAQASILHIPKRDVPELFSSFSEKLVAGGYLYVSVKEPRPGQREEDTLMENDYGYSYERFFSYFTMEEMAKLFVDTGFEIRHQDMDQSNKTRWLHVIGQRV